LQGVVAIGVGGLVRRRILVTVVRDFEAALPRD